MINQYPLWKNLAIVLVLLVGLVYALPNIYGEDPALHPKFQEEWSRIKSDLDTQYNQALDQHKDSVAQRFSVTV